MNDKNILLIIADQWRAQSCGYAGNADVQTPHLDAFAAESCNLSHAISSCPVCTPTRASLLTGLYPDKHGLFLNDVALDPELPGFGKHFKQLGYDTAWIGKWHVDGHHRYGHIPADRRHSFDYWQVLECTHDYWHSRYYENDEEDIKIWPAYDAEAQTDSMISWLHERNPNNNFCAVLSWGPPHCPYHTAPDEFKALYDPQKITLPENVPADQEEQARERLAGYYAHCSALDAYFGKLMACIDELNLSDDTIVMFTSDHGDMVGAHGFYDKQCPWDESIRIPCLIRAPELIPAGEHTALFNLCDFWPTICGLLQQDVQANIQGRDWSPSLKSQAVPEDNYALYASYHVFGNWPGQAQHLDALFHAREARGVRSERYTYVEDLNGPWILYDNHHDPLQLENLINSTEHESIQTQHATALHAKLEELDDQFLSGMEYVNQWSYTVSDNGTVPIEDWHG